MSEIMNHDDAMNPADDAAEGLDEALAQPETEFVATEKKAVNTSTLVIFGILLLGVAGMYFMYVRSGPSTAEASDETQASAATINNFLNDGGQNLKQMEQMLRNTEKVVEQFTNYPSANQVPLEDLQTNPFRYAGHKAATDTTPDDSAVSKRKREELRQTALQAVQNLKLQSVVHSGSRKACMINNTLYTEGQEVDAFTIEKINPNAVIVKTGTFRFELRMQK